MRLLVQTPLQVEVDTETSRISGESRRGSFGILPRHRDIALVLVPGLLSYAGADGDEEVLAVDEGILVKQGPEVRVAVRDAIGGVTLEALRARMELHFRNRDERELLARSALANLEARFLRRFLQEVSRGG